MGSVTRLAVLLAALLGALPARAQAPLPADAGDDGDVAYAPARGTYAMLLFEDIWPGAADFDFNDQSVAYHFTLVRDAAGRTRRLQADFSLLSLGASLGGGLYLHLPVPREAARAVVLRTGDTEVRLQPVEGEPELVLELVPDTRVLFGWAPGLLNTEPGQPLVPARPLALRVDFVQPVALDVAAAPFDLFLARSGAYGHQVHLPQYAGTARMDTSLFGTGADGSTATRHFVTQQGLPYVLHVPRLTPWPLERVRIDRAYPDVVDFVASGGARGGDWYLRPVESATAPVVPPLPTPSQGFAEQPGGTQDACVSANGLAWCFDPSGCGRACEAVCSALGRGPPVDDATWFAAQDTPEECQAVARALGLGPGVYFNAYRSACVEDAYGAGREGGRPVGPLYCSSAPSCPAHHRQGMDQLGATCERGRRSICPCTP